MGDAMKRVGLWIGGIGLGLAILGNICALVWGAAIISTSVDGLKDVTVELRLTTEQLRGTVYDLDARVRVLEDRAVR